MKRMLANYADDILLVLGCIFILIGLSMWSAIVTWIAAGVMLIGGGILIGKVANKS